MTYLRYGGIFKYQSVANFLLSLSVKKFRKSVNVWRSYGQEFSVLFFIDSRCTSGDSDVISMLAGFRRHLVGKTLRNMFHCDIAEIRLIHRVK